MMATTSRGWRAVALGFFVLIAAGCVESAKVQEGPAADVATAAVGGVVVDDSQRPIEGVVVRLVAKDARRTLVEATATDLAGAFSFPSVSAGWYEVYGLAEGFAEASKEVRVVPPEPSTVRLVLASVPRDLPYAVPDIRTGHITCAASVVLMATSCDNLLNKTFGVAPLGDKHVFLRVVPKGHRLIVGETQSTSRNVAMSALYNINRTVGLREVVGLPLLRAELEPGREYFTNGSLLTKGPVPPSTAWFGLAVLANYAGLFQKEIEGAADSVCRVQGFACTGVGATTDHRFEHYLTVFVGGLPPDAASYSAVPK